VRKVLSGTASGTDSRLVLGGALTVEEVCWNSHLREGSENPSQNDSVVVVMMMMMMMMNLGGTGHWAYGVTGQL